MKFKETPKQAAKKTTSDKHKAASPSDVKVSIMLDASNKMELVQTKEASRSARARFEWSGTIDGFDVYVTCYQNK